MITLTVSPQHLDIIMKALIQQPWASVNEVVQSIVSQANKQQEPPATS